MSSVPVPSPDSRVYRVANPSEYACPHGFAPNGAVVEMVSPGNEDVLFWFN